MPELNAKTAIDEYFNAKLKSINLRKKVRFNLNLYSALTVLDGLMALAIEPEVPEDHRKVYEKITTEMVQSLQLVEPKLSDFLRHIQTDWRHYKDEIQNSNLSQDL